MTHSTYLTTTLLNVQTGYDFTDRQKAVLGLVVEHADTKYGARELREALQTNGPTITRALTLLEEHGYVTRRARQDDRRLITVAATAQGRDAWQRMAGLPRLGRRAA